MKTQQTFQIPAHQCTQYTQHAQHTQRTQHAKHHTSHHAVWLFALICSVLCCLVYTSESLAQSSGVVSGTVRGMDSRANPYGNLLFAPQAKQQHLLRSFLTPAPIRRLAQALVEVRIDFGSGPKTFWTITADDGFYRVPWSHSSQNPTNINVRVYAARPILDTGAVVTTKPPLAFKINPFINLDDLDFVETVFASQVVTTSLLGDRRIDFTMNAASETLDTFFSAEEIFDLIHANNTLHIKLNTSPPIISTSNDTMKSLVRDVSYSIKAPFGTSNVTPMKHWVVLSGGTPTNFPSVVAHETGHAVEWSLTGSDIAPLVDNVFLVFPGGVYDECNSEIPASPPNAFTNPQDLFPWHRNSFECEKASFQEGFADYFMANWMWPPNAGQPTYESNLIRANELRDVSTVFTDTERQLCEDLSISPRIPKCNSKILWAITDKPTTDNDPFQDFSLGDVFSVLYSYPRGCWPFFDNGCARENNKHGMNWKDFKRNFINLWGTGGLTNPHQNVANRLNELEEQHHFETSVD